MTYAQLWSLVNDETKPQSIITSSKEVDIRFRASPKLDFDNKHRNGGAFIPFSKEQNSCLQASTLWVLLELALASTEKEMEEKKCAEAESVVSCSKRESFGKGGNGRVVVGQGKGTAVASEAQTTSATTTTIATTTNETHRKARRCWSLELHRRFVNALQMLDGSQGITNFKRQKLKG